MVTIVNDQGHLEDNDISHENGQESQADLSFPNGRRDTLRRAFGSGETSSDDEDLELYSDGELENHSLLKLSGHPSVPQADSGMQPSFHPSSGQEGKTS